jgi:WD40 repeat protein
MVSTADQPSPAGGSGSAGGGPGYAAFISYSHALDDKLAPALQAGLQRFAKPWYRLRALRVFRDDASLSANPALWSSIQAALEGSEFFILLASPQAARSHWVEREVGHWASQKPRENFLIALTDGEVVWDPAAGDFDWSRTTALPTSLRGALVDEPRYIDLRWARREEHLSLTDGRFRDCVADLAAPLHHRAKDDLAGEDVRQHRRAVRLAQIVVVLLVLLTLGTASGAFIAVDQRDRARQQTVLAESRALVNAAGSTAPTRLDASLLLAERAARMHPTPETRAALLAAVTASPHLARFVQQPSAVSALADLPGAGMAVGRADGGVSLLDADHRHERALGGTGTGSVTALAAAAHLLVAADRQGTLRLWSLADGKLRWHRAERPDEAVSAAIAPDGQTVALATKAGALVVLDARDGAVRGIAARGLSGVVLENLWFLDNRRVLVGGRYGDAQVWEVDDRPRRLRQHDQLIFADERLATAWSEDGRTFARTDSSHQTTVFDAVTGRPRGEAFSSVPPTLEPMAVDDRGDRAAFLYRGSLSVFDRSARAAEAGRERVELPGFSRAERLTFSPDGRWLLATGGTTIAVFDLEQRGRLARELPAEIDPLLCRACRTTLAADPLGRSLVWTDGPRMVCWDLGSDREGSVLQGADSSGPVAFTPDGSMLVVGTAAGLAISPTPSGCPTADPVLRVPGPSSYGLLPLGATRMLAWGSEGELARLVDLRLGREVRTYRAHLEPSAYVGDLAASSDARTFAVTISTGDVLWYDVETGAQVGVVHSGTDSPGALAFTPGSRRVARTTATSVQLWDPDGRLAGQLDGSAQRLRFSPNGRLLFGLDNEELLRVWDAPSGSALGTLQALPLVDDRGNPTAGGAAYGLRTGMDLGPDGTLWFAAASARPTGWSFSFTAWGRLACSWAGRSLTRDEWLHYVGTTPPSDLACGR